MTESLGPSWRTVAYVVVSVTAFGGGGALYNRINDPRPDPYTGTDALIEIEGNRIRHEELMQRLHIIELASQQIRSDLNHLVSLVSDHRDRQSHDAQK